MDSTFQSSASNFEALTGELRQFFKTELASLAVSKIDIENGKDHDGDSVINVIVKHRLSTKPLNPNVLFRVDGQARDLAWKLGERRFVHVRHVFDKKQEIAA